ncbi:MAG TPA: rhomboid family intramembrane serine protease [Bdellovibrionales bacterium]|nr:rhomboid family intramembrane serine protease [Bdellovibrionales bacterium]
MNQPQIQMVVPFNKSVRVLVIANVAIWVLGVLILQGLVFGDTRLLDWFALTPSRVISDFWVWQLGTYMFLHASGVFHVLFNMLILWWFGAELESRWGTRFFVTYYLVCGIGAGALYVIGTLLYYLVTGNALVMATPLVGASGATYGLLLAFGILFGERVIHFMMLFPMKAKWFVCIIGAVELLTMLDAGMGSQTSNLAHLGGIVVGFVFLSFVARWRARNGPGASSKRGRRLKLVVNNESSSRPRGGDGPKYWN